MNADKLVDVVKMFEKGRVSDIRFTSVSCGIIGRYVRSKCNDAWVYGWEFMQYFAVTVR